MKCSADRHVHGSKSLINDIGFAAEFFSIGRRPQDFWLRIGDGDHSYPGLLYLSRRDGVPEEIRTDATVLAIGVRGSNALEKECAGHFERLYPIGDAVKIRAYWKCYPQHL